MPYPRRHSSPWISSVAPRRVLSGECGCPVAAVRVDRWATGLAVGGWVQWRATRRRCQRSTVCGRTIRQRGLLTGTVHRRGENSEDRAVGVGELCSGDLALQNEDLVAQGEDLGVAGVAGGEQPPESGQNEASQSREQGHERRTLPTRPTLETPGIARRMSIRHPHAQRSGSVGGVQPVLRLALGRRRVAALRVSLEHPSNPR